MNKKIPLILAACCMSFGMLSCGKHEFHDKTTEDKIHEIYNRAVVEGETNLSYEEWLETIIGPEGKPGKDGTPGKDGAPGKDGEPGKDGLSAYEIYLKYHPDYKGTEEEWIETLINGSKLKTYRVTFTVDGQILKSLECSNNEKVAKIADPIKDGYYFEGWYFGNLKWDFNTNTVVQDTNLVAKFVEKESLVTDGPTNIIATINERIPLNFYVNHSNVQINLSDLKIKSDNPNDEYIINGNAITFLKEGNYTITFSSARYHSIVITFEITGINNKTAAIVNKASLMTLSELEEASKQEMSKPNKTFKIVGMISSLATAAEAFAKKYNWLNYSREHFDNNNFNISVNNSFRDSTLYSALNNAADSYYADFAMVQDAKTLSEYIDSGILHNFIPKDYQALGLANKDIYPLKSVYFNKVFYYNKEILPENALNNVWQLAGSQEDEGHLNNLSFMSPTMEATNLNFLLSLYSKGAQDRLTAAYKKFYNTRTVDLSYIDSKGQVRNYNHIGEKYVREFINNVTTWHSSDGTAMKETQHLEVVQDGEDPYIYYGSFGKMKDAAKKIYDRDNNPDTPKTCAMDTVKRNSNIEGFNGYMYSMYSQICNNAENPYTACLFARFFLLPETYKTMYYNNLTPDKDGTPGNQYGYYSPVTTDLVRSNDNDWSKDTWINKSINEDYDYLKTIKSSDVNTILGYLNMPTI